MANDVEYEVDENDDAASEDSAAPAETCEDDRCGGPQLPIWHCVDCDSSYCSDCWGRQGPHKPRKKGRDGVPHEKTNPFVVRRLKQILNPTRKPEEIQKLHEDDAATKWFGVNRDLTGRPVFEEYDRYASLMSSISPVESSTGIRYPQLVSFIGVTNAGKSTLIKLLINHEIEALAVENRHVFASPVVGSVVNDSVPTSGDVHLYADPSTYMEQLPILYADCEGFEGGERTPLGARARRLARGESKDDSSGPNNVRSRPIEWANTEESRQREYAVTALYPRLLYTFSDCVVFVLRNAKTFQSSVLTKLLDWGVAALERSINQPSLPHCIVALNGTDPAVDEREWDTNYATQSLLSSVKGALDYVEGVPRFRELAEHWRSLGKHIYTVEDLILRYYSSFKVIRIPSKPRYMTINQQIGKLHATIKANCEESFRTKRRARMLTNADELNVYLQSGFDHFTTHLNVPFNFMESSLLRNPIPNDFGGHILQLCTTISAQRADHQPEKVTWMFEKLAVMLASCVLLDCARYRKGRVDELFANYEKFFDYAMGEYLELHFPCSFVSPDGSRRCMLVKARHQPKGGHQDEKGIFAAGEYESALDANFTHQWKGQLRAAIEGIHRDFSYELEQTTQTADLHAVSEESIALVLHSEYLNQFFEALGPATAICSHATCFCCLMDTPEHALPCGHVLCTACVKAYGKAGKNNFSLPSCPLHHEATKWSKPLIIRFKPAGAGVRVLSLDGGGIRGIVQLEVLRAIELAIGGYLPVQSFFDLVIGTGTGGMLGVALCLKGRSVESTIDMFGAICDHAFTRKVKGGAVISQIAQVFGSTPRYKTKPLHTALQTAFTEDDDLFSANSRLRPGVRVAVTATSVTGRESIVLASYRRPDDPLPTYSFERPHEPEMELKIWESVAVALAAPTFFRPHSFHGKTYLDGGLRCPNPSFIADRERRLIWPDVEEPDLFLSLGTGQNRLTVLQKLSEKSKQFIDSESGSGVLEARKLSGRWRSKRVDDVLDAEIAWVDFRQHAVRERSEAKGRRFIRFNPDLDQEPPAQDSKSSIDALQANVRRRLQTPHRLAALRNVAHRLVASSFYFELQGKTTSDRGERLVTGIITCRFEDGSMEMCALGKVLEDKRGSDFEPYFLIKPDTTVAAPAIKIPITMDVIRGMTDSAVFGLPNVTIPLRDESKATSVNLFLTPHDGLEPDGFPLSGFPRVLLGETTEHKRRGATVRASSEQSVRNPSRHMKTTSDVDSISLNGSNNGMHVNRGGSIEESWQDTQIKMLQFSANSGKPKMSLADIIAQHQNSGSSIKQKTNRFWTYIGNNHMAQHPELYTSEELAKFNVNAGGVPPTNGSTTAESDATAPRYTARDPASNASLTPTSSTYAQEEPYELEVNPRSPPRSVSTTTIEKTDRHPEHVQVESSRTVFRYDARHELPSFRRTSSFTSQPFDTPPPEEDEKEQDTEIGVREQDLADDISTDTEHDIHLAREAAIVQLPPPYRNHEPGSGLTRSVLDSVVETALPDKNTMSQLDQWLMAQRSTGTLQRKAGRLRVVDEEIAEEEEEA